ncbi:MAG: hypothetical protein LC775_14555, partial [Acidobacteria bacterium]|nr:hypothetical protein [Acidobacteriota bacterium]
LEIHVVLDNLSAHKAPAVQRWLLRHSRVHFHFTPDITPDARVLFVTALAGLVTGLVASLLPASTLTRRFGLTRSIPQPRAATSRTRLRPVSEFDASSIMPPRRLWTRKGYRERSELTAARRSPVRHTLDSCATR